MGNIASSTQRIKEHNFSIGGHCKMAIRDLGGSASYATNGDTLTANQLGFGPNGKILHCSGGRTNSGTYDFRVIYPVEGETGTVKLLFTVVATGAEVANAVDLSAERFRVQAVGKQ